MYSERSCEKKIRDGVEKYNPDVIVSVHPTMNNVPVIATEDARKKYNKCITLFAVVADYSTGYCTWFCKDVDKLFISSFSAERLAAKRGKGPILTSRFPVRRNFTAHTNALGQHRRYAEVQKHQANTRTQFES